MCNHTSTNYQFSTDGVQLVCEACGALVKGFSASGQNVSILEVEEVLANIRATIQEYDNLLGKVDAVAQNIHGLLGKAGETA